MVNAEFPAFIRRPLVACLDEASIQKYLEFRAFAPEVIHLLYVLVDEIEQKVFVRQRYFHGFSSGFACPRQCRDLFGGQLQFHLEIGKPS
jgi:hypothetical protein